LPNVVGESIMHSQEDVNTENASPNDNSFSKTEKNAGKKKKHMNLPKYLLINTSDV